MASDTNVFFFTSVVVLFGVQEEMDGGILNPGSGMETTQRYNRHRLGVRPVGLVSLKEETVDR